jgi:hypothetical protein
VTLSPVDMTPTEHVPFVGAHFAIRFSFFFVQKKKQSMISTVHFLGTEAVTVNPAAHI